MPTNDFAHGYSPPGVYIEEVTTPLVGTTGLPPTLVAIVGPSVGYQTASEQFTLATGGPWRLAKKGVLQSSLVVQRVDTGAVLTSSDYTLATTSSPTTNPDYYTDVTRTSSGGTLSADTPVIVTYRHAGPDFFVPRRFTSYEDVKDAFGEPLNLTAPTLGQADYRAVTSPLSLAAKVAFENGAGELVLVATTPPPASATTAAAISAARRAALAVAYAKIATDYAVNLVVPLTDGIIEGDAAGAGTELTSHVNSATADGYRRFGMLGFDPGVGSAPDTMLGSGGFRSKRVALPFASPGGMSFFNGSSNQFLALGHQYAAAGLAGRSAALPVQKSLTREILRSFSGIAGTPLSNSTKNAYAAGGVMVLETDRSGQIVVRHGLTTDTSSLDTREMSVIRARDALVTLFESGFGDSGLIGQPIDGTTPLTIKSVAAGFLEHAKLNGVIVDYQSLAVRQRSLDPSVIEVKFAYKPSYPLNYIVVSFSVNVATGTTDDLTETAA